MKFINISIIDNNQYFSAGLRHALADFYFAKGTYVRLIEKNPSKLSIDILFHAISHGVPNNYNNILLHNTFKPLFFAIQDKGESGLTHMFRYMRKDGTVYRHQPIGFVLNMVEQARSIASHSSSSASHGSVSQTITHREHEVLDFLKQGLNLTQTAYYMNLSVKTVSAHKRSVMRKLKFRRNNELLYWMLQGGLYKQAEEVTTGKVPMANHSKASKDEVTSPTGNV
ncbi:response regulator transcription factor [Serratia fonticola]|uniref:response regulator transcription factor n=1 Tax=Serratia fonticola TaxID=47917 RepID=UPI003AAAD2EE